MNARSRSPQQYNAITLPEPVRGFVVEVEPAERHDRVTYTTDHGVRYNVYVPHAEGETRSAVRVNQNITIHHPFRGAQFGVMDVDLFLRADVSEDMDRADLQVVEVGKVPFYTDPALVKTPVQYGIVDEIVTEPPRLAGQNEKSYALTLTTSGQRYARLAIADGALTIRAPNEKALANRSGVITDTEAFYAGGIATKVTDVPPLVAREDMVVAMGEVAFVFRPDGKLRGVTPTRPSSYPAPLPA